MVIETVIDCETNGLLETVSKVHCLGYQDYSMSEPEVLTDYKDIKEFLGQPRRLIAHNIVAYDIKVFNKLLSTDIQWKDVWDTLWMSRNLYPKRAKHGLGAWGEDLGIAKPDVSDWVDGTLETYINRVTEDVKINYELWFNNLRKKYLEIYT